MGAVASAVGRGSQRGVDDWDEISGIVMYFAKIVKVAESGDLGFVAGSGLFDVFGEGVKPNGKSVRLAASCRLHGTGNPQKSLKSLSSLSEVCWRNGKKLVDWFQKLNLLVLTNPLLGEVISEMTVISLITSRGRTFPFHFF